MLRSAAPNKIEVSESVRSTESWAGEFYFGDSWAAFRGRAADNETHSHAALQLCLSNAEPISLLDERGRLSSGWAMWVRPGAGHRLEPIKAVTLLFVEPQSELAARFLDPSEAGDIGTIAADLAESIQLDGSLHSLLAHLPLHAGQRSEGLDSRIRNALDYLDGAPLHNAISGAASHCGLSQPRLRALAQEQLGVPLSKWLTWRAMRRAALRLAEGANLADAAHAGGFADQAHFTRTTRKMLGITPAQARRALL